MIAIGITVALLLFACVMHATATTWISRLVQMIVIVTCTAALTFHLIGLKPKTAPTTPARTVQT